MSWSRSPGQNLGSGAGTLTPPPTPLFSLLNPTLMVVNIVEGVGLSFPVVAPKTPTRRRLFKSVLLLIGEEASSPIVEFTLGDKAVVVRLVEGEGEGGKDEFGIAGAVGGVPFCSSSSVEGRGDDDRVPSPWIKALNFLFVAFMVAKWVDFEYNGQGIKLDDYATGWVL